MRRSRISIVALALVSAALATRLVAADAVADSIPRLAERDRVRLAEAFRLAAAVQDKIWPGWSSAPFAVLLVTPETEFLIRHPSAGSGFSGGEYDSLLESRVWWRRRVFPTTFQATFPAVGGIATVVIGQPEQARPPQSSTRWILTVMHEHFHQWQESRPGYMADVDSLHLARGDTTGMWMLNFPFPYSDSTIARSFEDLCRLRLAALEARGTGGFAAAAQAFDRARRAFEALLAPDDLSYLRFQLWKEGVAQYTEYDIARTAARSYRPSTRYTRLEDYTSFEAEAGHVLDGIERELGTLRLSSSQRVAVYSAGAADTLLLDELRPQWKQSYTRERFSLDAMFAPKPGR